MTRLQWNAPGSRTYETGVDRGVFYPQEGDGVPWNGLVSVSESGAGEARPFYLDGLKYLNLSPLSEFACAVESVSEPTGFNAYTGETEIHNGLFASDQPRKTFDFSYRTLIGNDILAENFGYKIHLVYNALATSSGRTYSTLGDSAEPENKTWDISTTPPVIPGLRPTAHLIVDSRTSNKAALALLEYILYGGETRAPRMPSPDEVLTIFGWEAEDLQTFTRIISEQDLDISEVENLVTNPSFESGSSPVVIRRNLIPNPSFEVNTAGWNVVSATILRTTSDSYVGSACLEVTHTSTATDSGAFISPRVATVAGQTHTISAYVKDVNSGGAYRIRVVFYDAPTGGAVIGPNILGAGQEISTDGWVRLSVTVTTPPGATNISTVISRTTSPVVGAKFLLDAVLNEVSPTLNPYFDGSTAAGGDFTYAWTGTANATASVQNAVGVAGGLNAESTCHAYQSVDWASSGNRSLRITPINTNSFTWANPVGQTGLTLGMVVGQTYTVVAKIRLESPQTGTPSSSARRILFLANEPPSGVTTVATSEQAPNTAGVHTIRLTFTVPTGATTAFLRLFNGASVGNGDVWWDDLIIVEGAYTGPYFDGGASAVYKNQLGATEWVAAENDSKSKLYYYDFLDQVGRPGDAHIINDEFWAWDTEGFWKNLGTVPVL